jgi:phosphohistidine phosphatase SixA
MAVELKKMQRRPFLVPLLLPVISVVILLAAVAFFLDARATTLVIVVRHAETDVSGAVDADLNLSGKERAARLARMFGKDQVVAGSSGKSLARPIDAIFAMDTRKSQQTAAPIGEALSLPISVLPSGTTTELVNRIRSEYRGNTVLVVANNTTMPKIVEELIGSTIAVNDNDYDRVALVVLPRLSRGRLLEWRY